MKSTHLVDALRINPVDPSLVEVDDEDEIVTEARQSVEEGHLDAESTKPTAQHV